MLNPLTKPFLNVIIQEVLLQDLKHSIEEYNQVNTYKLKLDVAVLFLSLFNSIPSNYRSDEHNNNVSLYSKSLSLYHSRYFIYFAFFHKAGYIKRVKNHSSDNGLSRVYSIKSQYLYKKLIIYSITDKCLLKKFNNKGNDENQLLNNLHCEKHRPFLTKYFNNNLTIDYKEAEKETFSTYTNNNNWGKYSSSLNSINEFKNQYWKYSIKQLTDNRFHSNLTRTPRVLRRYLRYNNESLVEIDLKTSQPFFLCVIIKAIIKRDKGFLDKFKTKDLLTDKIIQELFDLELNKDELANFIMTVLNKDLYNHFAKKLEINYNEEGLPYRVVSNYSSKDKRKKRRVFDIDMPPTRIETYVSERELAKEVIMEIFYSKTNTTIKEAKVFRLNYNSIYKIFKCLEDNKVKLSRLLQYEEAFTLLDHVAKVVVEKYPKMPLFSIHDSLITTEKWKDKLKEEMLIQVKAFTTLTPKVEIEYWDNRNIKEAI